MSQFAVHKTEQAKLISSELGGRLPSVAWRTRFAPAPTGLLHLGHIVNAIHVWGIARAYGGEVLLRIEDHDRQRCRTEFETALLDDLNWLGFAPDIGATSEFRQGTHTLRQSDNSARFDSALNELDERNLLYACLCSRRDIELASSSSGSDELLYPGTCSARGVDQQSTTARRIRLTAAEQSFNDLRLGAQSQTPSLQCGDFLLRDRFGQNTYQFSVAVDDFEQKIDVIIRGEDLLASTGRQLQLARILGRHEQPLFFHHTLLRRADGLKLSKTLGDTGVREMRNCGTSAEQVLGKAAHAAGLIEKPVPLSQAQLKNLFTPTA
ncbi:MAG: glutamate--tRNA ligase family protein [Gemmatimonadaceae bacterium]